MRDPIYKSRPVEPNAAKFGGERINDFVVMSEGFSNCYLIVTAAGNIQLNSGMALEAPVHRANFEQFSKAPLTHLILTQGHVDHVGGVQYFRDQNSGLQVIATAGNSEHQTYDKRLQAFRGGRSAFAFTDKFTAAIEYYQRHGYQEYPEQDVPVPDVLFEGTHKIEIGGLQLELIAVPGAETNDSLIVWLPQHKICFTGNLFGCPFGHVPNLVTIRGDRYRDALTVATAVETVMELGAETIIYGHHSPIHGRELIETELHALHDAILYVHDETVAGMNAGKDVHTLMQEIELPPEMEVGQGYGKVSWSIRAIWEHYAGWFHHQSTTELYSVPQTSVHADLIELAGGADALVERAQDKCSAGQSEQALHLLDIVLSVEPDHSGAVSQALEVHRTLAGQSENFWLSSWLNHQQALLQARL
ncbi:MAG: alkyl sulfatase dimerization domain-containing protein [Halioglobus sp.]